MAHHVELFFDFPAQFELSVLERVDRMGYSRAFQFPDAIPLDSQRELSAGVLLGVRPAQGEPWIGDFQLRSEVSVGIGRCVLGWPDGRSICVVHRGEACVVDTFAPESTYVIDSLVLDVLVAPDNGLIVFADYTSAVAYGPDGKVWQSDRLAWDELKLLRIDGARLIASGYDPTGSPRGNYPEFQVDLVDGSSDDAPYVVSGW